MVIEQEETDKKVIRDYTELLTGREIKKEYQQKLLQ